VVVPVTPNHPRQYRILEKIAAELGLPLLDTTSLDVGDASLWLPRDGHFSAAGARRLAELEAAFLRRAAARGTPG
jgi:lysophospholipase L1-like esterase